MIRRDRLAEVDYIGPCRLGEAFGHYLSTREPREGSEEGGYMIFLEC